ncbi:chemotaxis protein CheY [Intrasporangium oryzae NRRL B-24470]|uniref:Transcriptional regulatory protein n=1 Tax=Intrasporangium oryzae NRRL B-24470 TaxID=1386089 RepID=W9G2F9_9MICO|nr:response regulator [Intrasporangium oryzae]EWT00175.1 chemotaxis protein CheY [Intrasporangium oryzae NRRL B-24470]
MTRVLVVDDDFMVARIHRGFVDRVAGFEVVGTAQTGAEAESLVAELRPDLVLLDLYLPDRFGLDVVARLRAAGETCDVLVITAAKEADSVRAAVRHGVVGYLLKPFTFADLELRLQAYAAERARSLSGDDLTQAEIDAAFTPPGVARPATVTLPKGLSAETAEAVERALRDSAATMSATECAEAVGISRVSARRYLEHFVTAGRVEVSLRYGATGRPERRYRSN